MATRPKTTLPDRETSQQRTTARVPAAKKTVAEKASKAIVPTPRLTIRMYRHGLGDCLLLRFRKDGAQSRKTFNLLIDCGIIMVAPNAKAEMTKVVQDIAQACDNHLDVVVMTHEHWDHASGFGTQQAQAVFDKIDIGEVWYAWTEDPQNALGARLRKERAQKVQALASAAAALTLQASNPLAIERATALGSLLGFFGLDLATAAGGTIGKTRAAFDYLLKRTGVKTRFCVPDKPPMTLPDVSNLRVYVLGPPQDEGLIKQSSPSKKRREVYELASESKLADNLESAFQRLSSVTRMGNAASTTIHDCPFDPTLRRRDSGSSRTSKDLQKLIAATWDAQGQEWRRIEDDWTQVAETLALNLDSHTNNTCLVLAFEFSDTGEVFLFPADAQVGNWLSWQNLRWNTKTPAGPVEVTGPDLLSRTVFYKVGHHGSHNATLRTLGLEQMTHENLVAFIPVCKAQAEKNRWFGMPFEPLVKRLQQKTGGRLLIADQPLPGAAELTTLSASAKRQFELAVESAPDNLWFEYRFG
jgi:hypothetical protein